MERLTSSSVPPTESDAGRRILDWLARACADPATAHTEWHARAVALLPTGRRFAAARIPAQVVHAAVSADADLPRTSAALASLLDGPVIHDHGGRLFYALVPCTASRGWTENSGAVLLGRDSYLGVPHIGRRRPPGTYWAVAPRGAGDLCAVGAVSELVTTGRMRLSAA
ncbi:hypothetical protein ACTWJ8_18095 [Streptomyces sp. SDT5-1]|uniref:hypothetical protein n=1 Tax=Streptomyces sp. SDT5-1 TaxID=3406418 RepID=UPI003FD52D8C